MSTDKRIFLITGCSSGIGLETSFTLANASPNNHVIFTARSSSKGKPLFEEVQARKPAGTLSWLELDVTSDASIEAATKAVEEKFGKLDVLVNNAGIAEPVALTDTVRPTYDRETIRRVFDTNAFGPLLLTQSLEHLLKKSSSPIIVNISTGLSSVGMKSDHEGGYAPVMYDVYRASKSALNMVAACYRWNYRDWAKVYTLCPGFVITNLSGPDDVEVRKQNGGLTPDVSANAVLDIVEGRREKDLGKFLSHEGGTYPW